MVVAQDNSPGQEASVAAEAVRVVELVLEHARSRPAESLGVIALGVKHAERIDLALREALAGVDPRVEVFFADDVPGPFFVKNLERVQGDERDAMESKARLAFWAWGLPPPPPPPLPPPRLRPR